MLVFVQRHRRGIGAWLIVYGVVGLLAGTILAGATLATVAGLQPAVEAIDRQVAAASAALDGAATSLDRTADVLDQGAESVASASSITSQVADVSRLGADTFSRLSGTIGNVSFLGQRPFENLAADAGQLSRQLRSIAVDVDALAIRLGQVGRSLPGLGEDLRRTAAEIATLVDELGGFEIPDAALASLTVLLLALAVLVAWLLVPAVVAIAVGIGLLRAPPGGPAAA